ncbi:Hypothetical predicted protein [Mytilus galloprovincialis]|uniref:C-type lectin domain-containing protein n=1 Tax=Mytilus galloprovincialis TaxID=29158 RepID=A0A8B6DN73_MYTGA|nr:Hypothetical predicted protein [Mytilus galloprovincialis]
MSALSFVIRVILFYTFISFSDSTLQWYDAVNLCKQQGQILHPEITSNESSFGYRQDTTMWTSSYILSVNHVKHTENSDKLIVLNIPLNYSQQDFVCSWDYQRRYPDTLLNITNLGVVRRVLGVMDFGQKYWLSNISESVYKLVHQCEVFRYVANSTSIRKSYTAMRFCDEMNSYKCVDGKKYRPAVSLVKYLHDRHGNYHDRERTNNSGKTNRYVRLRKKCTSIRKNVKLGNFLQNEDLMNMIIEQ